MISTACAAIASILVRIRADHRRGRPTIKRGTLALLGVLLGVLLVGACAPVEIPAGPAGTKPSLHDSYVVATDGAHLPLRTWPARDGHPRAVILGLHGFGDYSNAFDEPAKRWARDGVTTYAYDQRGFGDAPHRGRWAATEAMVDDARTALKLIAARHPGVPLYLMGESMGGAVALVALAERAENRGEAVPLAGAILIGPAVRSRDTVGAMARAGAWFFAHTVPWLPTGPTSIDFQPSDNKAMLRKYANDPKVLRQYRLDMGWGLLDLMDQAKAAAPHIDVPYLLLYGDKDRLVPEGPMRAAIALMPARPDSKIAVYPNGYHMLLRDLNAAKPQADVLAWIGDKTARLPSGADSARPDLLAAWGNSR
ncbi:MAG: lysophospholipase [Reyranellaceae bacterium]